MERKHEACEASERSTHEEPQIKILSLLHVGSEKALFTKLHVNEAFYMFVLTSMSSIVRANFTREDLLTCLKFTRMVE